MRGPRVQFTVRTMLIVVGIAGIGSAIAAVERRHHESRLRHLVFEASLRARWELGDLSAYVIQSGWAGDRAQVDFLPEDPAKARGRRYLVDSCSCGLKITVQSFPIP